MRNGEIRMNELKSCCTGSRLLVKVFVNSSQVELDLDFAHSVPPDCARDNPEGRLASASLVSN